MREPSLPRRLALTLVALAAAGAATGCSTIPVDEQARGVDDVPDDFLVITTTSLVDSIPEEVDPPHVLILYFVNADGLLVQVERPREEVPSLREAIDALTVAPTELELEEHPGISTSLLPGLEPAAGTLTESGVLPIQVSGEELRISSTEAPDRVRLVYSQIVCTMVAFNPAIKAVQINDDEGAIRVQGQEGAPVEGAVTRAEVNDCKTAEEIAAEIIEETEGTEDEPTSTTEGG